MLYGCILPSASEMTLRNDQLRITAFSVSTPGRSAGGGLDLGYGQVRALRGAGEHGCNRARCQRPHLHMITNRSVRRIGC